MKSWRLGCRMVCHSFAFEARRWVNHGAIRHCQGTSRYTISRIILQIPLYRKEIVRAVCPSVVCQLAHVDLVAILPTSLTPLAQICIQAIVWVRVPPPSADDVTEPDLKGDPFMIAATSYDGSLYVMDTREPYGHSIFRSRGSSSWHHKSDLWM